MMKCEMFEIFTRYDFRFSESSLNYNCVELWDEKMILFLFSRFHGSQDLSIHTVALMCGQSRIR